MEEGREREGYKGRTMGKSFERERDIVKKGKRREESVESEDNGQNRTVIAHPRLLTSPTASTHL